MGMRNLKSLDGGNKMRAFTDTIVTKKEMVRSYLKAKGFTVSRDLKAETSNGIDIVAIKDNLYFTIEVKSVAVSKKSLTVKKILASGKKCDYIAIVTPRNKIIFQPMLEHLKMCSPSGERGVTKLVRLYDSL